MLDIALKPYYYPSCQQELMCLNEYQSSDQSQQELTADYYMDCMWIKIDGIVYLNESADLCKEAH